MPLCDGRPTGKFRNLLLPAEMLKEEARELRPHLEQLFRLYQQQAIPAALYALAFVLLYVLRRLSLFVKKYNDRYNYWQQVLFLVTAGQPPGLKTLCDALYREQLRGMPGFVFPLLARWLQGRLRVQLTGSVVSAAEMLAAQAEGWRYVTLPLQEALNGQMIENRDALEFLLHDLAHAGTFFKAEYDPAGQQQFFASLRSDIPLLQPLAATDGKFRSQLEYLMSDMNSHPQHLRQYLRAIVLDFYGRSGSAAAAANLLGQLQTLGTSEKLAV